MMKDPFQWNYGTNTKKNVIHSMNSVGVKNISELLNHYGYRRVYGILSQI